MGKNKNKTQNISPGAKIEREFLLPFLLTFFLRKLKTNTSLIESGK